MKSSHCEDKQEDRPLDILTDEEKGSESSSRGWANLISLARISEAGEWNGPVFSPGMGTVLGPDRSSLMKLLKIRKTFKQFRPPANCAPVLA